MKVAFWNTRPESPLFVGIHDIEFRGMVSATIPLPEKDALSSLLVANEMHHLIDNSPPDTYVEDQRFATVKKVSVDRKHGPPKLRYYFR